MHGGALVSTPLNRTAAKNPDILSGSVDDIVAEVRSAKALDRAAVERIIGHTLTPSLNTNYTQIYKAENIKNGSLTLNAELREPKVDSGAEPGALLIIQVVSGCPRFDDIKARYSP